MTVVRSGSDESEEGGTDRVNKMVGVLVLLSE